MAGLPPHDPDEPQSTRLARNFSELLQEPADDQRHERQ